MGLFKTAKIGPTISLLVLGNFEVLKCYKNGLYSNNLNKYTLGPSSTILYSDCPIDV